MKIPADWTQINDEDEIRAVCECGYRGEWRDMLRPAYDDQDEHRSFHTRGDVEVIP